MGENLHPQYPALDLDSLPGDGGGSHAYLPPAEPTTERTVTIDATGTDAADAIEIACSTPGTLVMVPDTAGEIGPLALGNVLDCDLLFGPDVVSTSLVIGMLPGQVHAPSQRVRIRGGQFARVFVRGGSTDLIFDGVVVNSGLQSETERSKVGFYFPEADGAVVERIVVVNSILRMVAVTREGEVGRIHGAGLLSHNARDVLFANNNVVTAGNHDSWGFRLNGGENTLFVDNTVRVSFHKLIRMNTEPVNYLYVSGGTWIRESTTPAVGDELNDSFTQLPGSSTDEVYIHDTEVYLLATPRANFGAAFDDNQVGRSWNAHRIRWHAVSESVISDSSLSEMQSYCVEGAVCDYGVGTHSFHYDPGLSVSPPWRDLPDVAIDDPDLLPTVP